LENVDNDDKEDEKPSVGVRHSSRLQAKIKILKIKQVPISAVILLLLA